VTAGGPAAVAPLVGRVARAVQYAHARGVLHRDLKPANILLSAAGDPLVADFGLAKLLAPDADCLTPVGAGDAAAWAAAGATVTGPQPGTPGYMAPKQLD